MRVAASTLATDRDHALAILADRLIDSAIPRAARPSPETRAAVQRWVFVALEEYESEIDRAFTGGGTDLPFVGTLYANPTATEVAPCHG